MSTGCVHKDDKEQKKWGENKEVEKGTERPAIEKGS